MPRRTYKEEHENQDRWLVSYADLITLLFAFFVVMYAISSVKETKYRVLSESISVAFGKAEPPAGQQAPGLAPSPARAAESLTPGWKHVAMRPDEREQMAEIADDMRKALMPLSEKGLITVTTTARGVAVEINAIVLFAPGDARLNMESSHTLIAVANVLKGSKHAIQVEGHTDNIPIHSAAFPSNWELSAARAGTVVRLFAEMGIDEGRLVAVGYGANQPVESNATAEGRLRNRRVQLLISPRPSQSVSDRAVL